MGWEEWMAVARKPDKRETPRCSALIHHNDTSIHINKNLRGPAGGNATVLPDSF